MSGSNLTDRISILKKSKIIKGSTDGSTGVSDRTEKPGLSGATAALRAPKPPGLSGWERLGEFLYRRREYVTGGFNSGFSIPPFGGMDRKAQLLFYDTETTGLSSGTGTFIFLLGMAWAEKSASAPAGTRSSTEPAAPRIILEQVFTADYPGEPEFLNYIGKRFKEFDLFVSFNGKSYDSHLLKTRFLMNRMDFELGEQYDLLHISRRLWSRLIGSCSLNSIEEKILGIHRRGDLPGYEVPERYFSFLRTGNARLLTDVFKHNRQDVISMAVLLNVIGKIFSEESIDIEFDNTSLGAYLIKNEALQNITLGEKHLKKGFESGDAKAGRFLSLIHKRKGNWERAVKIWHKMAERKSLFAVTELAKYYEHKKRDYYKALMWVNKYLLWNLPLNANDRYEIIRRKNRLLSRIKNRKS